MARAGTGANPMTAALRCRDRAGSGRLLVVSSDR